MAILSKGDKPDNLNHLILQNLTLPILRSMFEFCCSLFEGRTSFDTGIICRKLCGFLFFFHATVLHSVAYFFFLYRSPSLCLCTVFDAISSKVYEVLWINPSANMFVFEDFNEHHKDWLTYFGGTDRLGKLCNNFFISNEISQMINFPT